MKGQRQNVFDWILENGEAFKGRTLTEDEEKELQCALSGRLYKAKQCFYASQMIALSSPEYHYYEGYAQVQSLGLNFEHGWLVKDGKVFDPTWKDATFYFGIEIPIGFVRKNISETGMAEPLLIKFFMEVGKGAER